MIVDGNISVFIFSICVMVYFKVGKIDFVIPGAGLRVYRQISIFIYTGKSMWEREFIWSVFLVDDILGFSDVLTWSWTIYIGYFRRGVMWKKVRAVSRQENVCRFGKKKFFVVSTKFEDWVFLIRVFFINDLMYRVV